MEEEKTMDNDSAANSIKAAFNLGVWMRQNEPGKDVFEAGRTLREIIQMNLRQPEEGQYPKDVIEANVSYLTDISLLGFLMSGVCSYDPEIKEKIPYLIEKKLVSGSFVDSPGDYSGSVSEKEDGDYFARSKAVGMN
jgi:hypothetical protein